MGIKVKIITEDSGAILDNMYRMSGDELEPDYDMFMWAWGAEGLDPQYILSICLTSQIGNLSDTYYSNKEYDKLFVEETRTLDPEERAALIAQMQEIIYEEAPYIVVAYPKMIEAWNSAKWEGWVHMPPEVGRVLYTGFHTDTYLLLHPKSETVASDTSNLGLIVGIVVAVVAALGIVAWLLLRHRRRAVEIDE